MTLLILSRFSFSWLQMLLQFGCWKCVQHANRIEKRRKGFVLFHSKAGKENQQSIRIMSSKIFIHCGKEEEGISRRLISGRASPLSHRNKSREQPPDFHIFHSFYYDTVLIVFSKFQNKKWMLEKLLGPEVGGCRSFGPLASRDLQVIVS